MWIMAIPLKACCLTLIPRDKGEYDPIIDVEEEPQSCPMDNYQPEYVKIRKGKPKRRLIPR